MGLTGGRQFGWAGTALVAESSLRVGCGGEASTKRPRSNEGAVVDEPEDPPDPKPERDRDDVPETPPTEPDPVPVQEPPAAPGEDGPYVVAREFGARTALE